MKERKRKKKTESKKNPQRNGVGKFVEILVFLIKFVWRKS